jgi:hypothetical protein
MRRFRFTEDISRRRCGKEKPARPSRRTAARVGISRSTTWKKTYGGLGVPGLRELKAICEETCRLKSLVAGERFARCELAHGRVP